MPEQNGFILNHPALVIVAGPNGSGKTTLTDEFFDSKDRSHLTWLNADNLTKQLLAENPQLPDANLQAAIQTDNALDDCISKRKSVLVETVLSSGKYRKRITAASKAGYKIYFLYVVLRDPQYNIDRVRQRVKEGGHDVPEKSIIDRYHRSVAEAISYFIHHADFTQVFDNTDDPEVILRITPTVVRCDDEDACIDIFPDFPKHLEALSKGRDRAFKY